MLSKIMYTSVCYDNCQLKHANKLIAISMLCLASTIAAPLDCYYYYY